MRPMVIRTSSRFERHLAGLRHSGLRRAVRFYFGHREKLLYLVVGGWNTVFGYGIWALLQVLLGDHLPYLAVLLLAWPLAVLNSYVGFRYLVFRSRGPVPREFPRFSLVYVVTLAANLVVLPAALRVLPFNIYVVEGIFTGLVVVGTYVSHKHFSFRGSAAPPSVSPSSTAARSGTIGAKVTQRSTASIGPRRKFVSPPQPDGDDATDLETK